MNIPRLFKLPRHRQFNYQPLYYDPEKEERQQRDQQIKAELGLNVPGTEYKPGIRRGSMKAYFKENKRAQRNSNLRLVLIIIFLLFISYMILFR